MMLLASAVIATALGGCPKPVHPVKHKPTAPLCSCVSEEPRVIMLPAPTPDPDPINLNVVRYYTLLSEDTNTESRDYDVQPSPFDNWSYWGGYAPAAQVKAPEIDPSSLGTGLTLLAGGLLVLTGRKQS